MWPFNLMKKNVELKIIIDRKSRLIEHLTYQVEDLHNQIKEIETMRDQYGYYLNALNKAAQIDKSPHAQVALDNSWIYFKNIKGKI